MHWHMHHDRFSAWYAHNEETILGIALLVLSVLLLLIFLLTAPEHLITPPTHGLSGQELLDYLKP